MIIISSLDTDSLTFYAIYFPLVANTWDFFSRKQYKAELAQDMYKHAWSIEFHRGVCGNDDKISSKVTIGAIYASLPQAMHSSCISSVDPADNRD